MLTSTSSLLSQVGNAHRLRAKMRSASFDF
jgi:hypothetical protein